MSIADLSKQALAARLVSLYDTAAAVNDRLRRHVDHVTYEGGMDTVELLQEELNDTMVMVIEHGLRPDPEYDTQEDTTDEDS